MSVANIVMRGGLTLAAAAVVFASVSLLRDDEPSVEMPEVAASSMVFSYEEEYPRPDVLGSQSCAVAACHGAAIESKGSKEPRDRAWYISHANALWLERDPHATAYRTLHNSLSKRIVRNLVGHEPNEGDHFNVIAVNCCGCHAPLNWRWYFHTDSTVILYDSISAEEAVSCEACHSYSGAGHWLLSHATGQEGSKKTMREIKPLPQRAALCARCHVGTGSPGQEVNHELIAAGHPRLNFEFRAYHDALPKHWMATEQDHNAEEAWNVGQHASSWTALAQAVNRIRAPVERRDNDTPAAWPEFAEMECYSCHSELQSTVSSTTESRGKLTLQAWYFEVPLAIDSLIPRPELKEQVELLEELLPVRDPLEHLQSRYVRSEFSPHLTSTGLAKAQQALEYEYPPLVDQLNVLAKRTEVRGHRWESHAMLYLLAETIHVEARQQLELGLIATEDIAAASEANQQLSQQLTTAHEALHPPAQFQAGEVQRQLIQQARKVASLLAQRSESP